MTHKRAPISTKLGFVGLGKYGYAVLWGTLGAGHHNLADIFVERLDRPTYSDNPDKLTELAANFEEVTAQWRRLAGISAGTVHDIQYEDIGGLIQKVAGAPGDLGVLLLSLNRTRGEAVLREIARHKERIRGTLWLFSSISRLTTDEIRSIVGSANVRVIRYLPNRATGEGAGIIATYAPSEELAEAPSLVNDVFHGLGVIRCVETESDIDAARIVFGASLGMVAWFAQALAFSIQQAKDGRPGLLRHALTFTPDGRSHVTFVSDTPGRVLTPCDASKPLTIDDVWLPYGYTRPLASLLNTRTIHKRHRLLFDLAGHLDLPTASDIYEVHLTIAPQGMPSLQAFASACNELGAKAIHIELPEGVVPSHLITSSFHRGSLEGVRGDAHVLGKQLEALGFEVTRIKIEAMVRKHLAQLHRLLRN